jgi:beta-mannosidase
MNRLIRSIAIFMVLTSNATSQNISLNWQIGYHKTEAAQPAKWIPATVPGAVQLDVMKAENYKQPWWYGENVSQFDWMEDVWFTYKTTFKKPELKNGERLFFFSKGIDYQFKIFLNGKMLWEQEGMFTYVDLDLTDGLQAQNELRIVLYPIPKLGFEDSPNSPDIYRRNARESVKPAVSYRWDWHPRCVTRGIWDETYLTVIQKVHLNDVSLSYTLNDELTQASVKVDVAGTQVSGKPYQWVLKAPDGKVVIEKQGILSDAPSIEAELSAPVLWWPNGYGDSHLYTSEFTLFDNNRRVLERQVSKTGFRRIRLVMNEGAWEESQPFPVTRSVSPAGLEVNNRRIFGKGSNWVHPEVFVGTITPERYREQLVLAKNANFNLLRVWGGGIVNKEAFFDICDELGILVWQEFPLACNNYPDKPDYLKVLEQEAISIVKRIKKHACLAIWSGGNELFNNWGGMTEQSHPLRLLNSICYRLDPQTPFIYTSPFYGVGHGHYLFYDKKIDKELFQWMAEAHRTAYTEFGVPAVSNLNVLKSFIPDDELFPPREGTAWSVHHGFGVWRNSSWLELETFQKYFGEPQSLEQLVDYSQLLQCEGLKFIYEEARRQKPYCCMALNWCFQEPWPSAANNSLINWPNEIKPAYYHVANALRPVLASVRIPKFEWQEGDDFACDLFLLNDTYESIAKAVITVTLCYDGKEESMMRWDCPGTDVFKNVQGPAVHFRIPRMMSNLFTVKVTVEGKSEYNSSYTLLYSDKDIKKVFPPKEYYEGK